MTMHRPVCTKCEVEFRCAKNGVEVLDHNELGPYIISQADEFECPVCLHRIIVGFGNPSARRSDGTLDGPIAWAERDGLLRHNFGDVYTLEQRKGMTP